jgi:hypothetical protein
MGRKFYSRREFVASSGAAILGAGALMRAAAAVGVRDADRARALHLVCLLQSRQIPFLRRRAHEALHGVPDSPRCRGARGSGVGFRRTGWNKEVWGANQRITVDEALRVNTINGAHATREETIKGSITPGKLADFVVLAEDPHTVDPSRIKDIKIVRTVVGGTTVFQA